MKYPIMVLFLLSSCAATPVEPQLPEEPNKPGDSDEWVLEWSDEFNSDTLDTSVWSLCDRGKSNWNKYMSKDASMIEFRDGTVVLRGVVNTHQDTDPVPYLTSGITTINKKAFQGGRLEVRARLQAAQGSWPAIWMLPFEYKKFPWPTGGEIDIVERLNFQPKVHQTVHSYYTYELKNKKNPPATKASAFEPDEFNVFAVEIDSTQVSFFINGEPSFSYPCVNGGAQGQFPFMNPMYLILDMQLGGSWAGNVNTADLPVEMQIDWVRYYVRPKTRP